jgi:hypothetical protein
MRQVILNLELKVGFMKNKKLIQMPDELIYLEPPLRYNFQVGLEPTHPMGNDLVNRRVYPFTTGPF